MSGLVGVTRRDATIDRITKHRLIKLFPGGPNPLDAGLQPLPNVNGQLTFKIENLTSGFIWEFEAAGGMGHFPVDPADNWGINLLQLSPSTLVVVKNGENDYTITTPAADGGGRDYHFVFSPYKSVPAEMELSGGAPLGADDVQVTIFFFRVRP